MKALIPLAGALAAWFAAFVVWAVVPPGPRLSCLRLLLMVTLMAGGNGLLLWAILLAFK